MLTFKGFVVVIIKFYKEQIAKIIVIIITTLYQV